MKCEYVCEQCHEKFYLYEQYCVSQEKINELVEYENRGWINIQRPIERIYLDKWSSKNYSQVHLIDNIVRPLHYECKRPPDNFKHHDPEMYTICYTKNIVYE